MALSDRCVDGRALARASGCARARRHPSGEQPARRRSWPEGASELQPLRNGHSAGRRTRPSADNSAVQSGTRHDLGVSDRAPTSPGRNRGSRARDRSEGSVPARRGQSAGAAAAGHGRAFARTSHRIVAGRRPGPCCLRYGYSAPSSGSPARHPAAAVAARSHCTRRRWCIPILAQPFAACSCRWAGAGSFHGAAAGARTCRTGGAGTGVSTRFATARIATAAGSGARARCPCTGRGRIDQSTSVDRRRNAAAAVHRDR